MRTDELQEVLSRAQEIQARSAPEDDPQVGSLLEAAAEVGINRDAVLQALRERIGPARPAYKPFDVVFGKTNDGSYYPATFISESGESCEIRFMNGAKALLPCSSVRPFVGMPNDAVICQWRFLGWKPSRILTVDMDKKMAKVAGPLGRTQWCMFHELRLPAESEDPRRRGPNRWLTYAALALGSALIGSILTWMTTH